VNPTELLEQFRAVLNRQGLTRASGRGWFALDGEFNSETKKFCLHLHGVTIGEMTGVIRKVRKLPKFRKGGVEHLGKQVTKRPIVGKHHTYGHLARLMTYVLKPACWQTNEFINSDGDIKRSKWSRMPDHATAAWLLWIDKWSVNDLSQIFGLRVVNRKLVATGW
jgi:hypothetical protein